MSVPDINNLTPQQALAYYANQLIIQYNGLPKASQHIQTLVNCAICDGFFFQLANCFNLSTAIGNQLTIIGLIVGVPRNIYGLNLTSTFFTFSNWNGQPASVGFNTWPTPVDPDYIDTWQTTAVYVPTDFEMRALIQLKIMYNNYLPSLGIIMPALYNLFSGSINVTDNFNTSITWNFKAPYHNVGSVCSFLGNIVPKPMGCGIIYNNI